MLVSVEDVITAVAVALVAAVAALLVDRLMKRREPRIDPQRLALYRTLRRMISLAIVVVGLTTAAMTFPSVRAAAAGLLASAAVFAVIIGIAARSSLGNFVSGLMLAFSQPIRIGDRIEFDGTAGVVQDVGRIYTRLRTGDGAWLHVPNDLLASETIRNWTIVSPECAAHVSVLLPLSSDLGQAMALLLEEARLQDGTVPGREPEVSVRSLTGGPTGTMAEVAVDIWASDHLASGRIASELRARVHERLRRAGMLDPA